MFVLLGNVNCLSLHFVTCIKGWKKSVKEVADGLDMLGGNSIYGSHQRTKHTQNNHFRKHTKETHEEGTEVKFKVSIIWSHDISLECQVTISTQE